MIIHKIDIGRENVSALADVKVFTSQAIRTAVEHINREKNPLIKNKTFVVDIEPIKD